MMFKISLVLMLLFTLSFGADADGFRKIKFGDAPLKEMIMKSYEKSSNTKKYYLKKEKLNIGDTKIGSILYLYFDNKFMGVIISFKGASNFYMLRDILEAKYGAFTPSNQGKDELYSSLEGGNSMLAIDYSYIKDDGTIFLCNSDLDKMSEKYQKNTDAINAHNDL